MGVHSSRIAAHRSGRAAADASGEVNTRTRSFSEAGRKTTRTKHRGNTVVIVADSRAVARHRRRFPQLDERVKSAEVPARGGSAQPQSRSPNAKPAVSVTTQQSTGSDHAVTASQLQVSSAGRKIALTAARICPRAYCRCRLSVGTVSPPIPWICHFLQSARRDNNNGKDMGWATAANRVIELPAPSGSGRAGVIRRTVGYCRT